ncbi:MAG: hypothetical protein HWE13_12570 [Gammaproteobacteria bacterium]|nr:hypothetical protein [Gammaproteobacteria bacterium]NVK88960.1 hypothetical protein [Gammaproteobacteria bacterium]
MNKLWGGMFTVAFIAALYQWLGLGNSEIFSQMMETIFAMANLSIEIAIGLVGLLCFWMGILKLAEAAGATRLLARVLAPLFQRLMPQVPADHPALGHITMNMAANFLGLDNAATPAGLKAMESLQTLNQKPDTASNAQILFLVINTSSVTLFPMTILMYRAQQGAAQPADVFIPILLATAVSTLVGLFAVAWVQKLKLWDKVVAAYLGGAALIIASIVYGFSQLPAEQMGALSAAIGNGLILTAICAFILVAAWRRVPIYDEFITGASAGFQLAVKIMPYLVAMLVAIGLLRTSGVLDAVVAIIASVVEWVGGDTRFVEALPTGLMKPFSASGSRAMMLEVMNSQGADAFAARLAAIFQGSTETTFYVLAVYFGVVNIKRVRHAIGCGLAADLGGIIAAVVIAYWFFG